MTWEEWSYSANRLPKGKKCFSDWKCKLLEKRRQGLGQMLYNPGYHLKGKLVMWSKKEPEMLHAVFF